MKKRVLIVVSILLLVAAGITVAQHQIPQPAGQSIGTGMALPPLPTNPSPHGVAALPAPIPAPPVAKVIKPEDMTIEQLIDAMEKTRDEIAEREKKNKAMLKVLQDKVNKLKVRMDSFGGKSEPATPGPAIPIPAPEVGSSSTQVPAFAGTTGLPHPENGSAPKQP